MYVKYLGIFWCQMVKSLPAIQTGVQSLGQEGPLEKETATHSSIPAWKIPWLEDPDKLQSMGSQRVGHNWATSQEDKKCEVFRIPCSGAIQWDLCNGLKYFLLMLEAPFYPSFPFNLLTELNNLYLGFLMNGAHSDAGKLPFEKENDWCSEVKEAKNCQERANFPLHSPSSPHPFLPYHTPRPIFPFRGNEAKHINGLKWFIPQSRKTTVPCKRWRKWAPLVDKWGF